jgi:hypothetical protein
MKSLIKNKSELVEIRFYYVILILHTTLVLTCGLQPRSDFSRKLYILLLAYSLPLARVIRLYSILPKLPKITSKILQSILIITFFVICFYLYALITYFAGISNDFFAKLLLCEFLFIIILHRYILFNNQYMVLSKYLLPVYRIFRKFYLDIVLLLLYYILIEPISDFKTFWKETYILNYQYIFYILIALIWFIVGKLFKKMIRRIIIRDKVMNKCDKYL